MSKRFTVCWTETYICKKVIEAETEQEAIDKAIDKVYDEDPDKKEFDGYADWEASPTDED